VFVSADAEAKVPIRDYPYEIPHLSHWLKHLGLHVLREENFNTKGTWYTYTSSSVAIPF